MTSRPDLRPRSIGENLDAGFKLFTSNFKPLVTVAAIILIPVAVLNGVITATAGDFNYLDLVTDAESFGTGDQIGAAFGAAIAAAFIAAVIGALAGLVVQAAAVGVIGDAYQGRSTTWREGFSVGIRKFFPVLLTGLLVGLVAIIIIVALAIVIAIAALISEVLAVFVAIIGFVGAAISIFTLAYVSVPALIVENLGPVGAIRRSIALVRQRFWPTFWTAVLGAIIVGIISVIVSSIIQLAVAGPAILSATETGELSGGLVFAASAVSSALVSIFSTPFLSAVGLAVYFDLRVRLEGFDLELLARDLGQGQAIDGPGSDDSGEDDTNPFGLDSPE